MKEDRARLVKERDAINAQADPAPAAAPAAAAAIGPGDEAPPADEQHDEQHGQHGPEWEAIIRSIGNDE